MQTSSPKDEVEKEFAQTAGQNIFVVLQRRRPQESTKKIWKANTPAKGKTNKRRTHQNNTPERNMEAMVPPLKTLKMKYGVILIFLNL